jgi:MscS family membrane protein
MISWSVNRSRFVSGALFVLLSCALSQAASAQFGAAAPAARPEPARDALGRDTPRGAVLGFINAGRSGNNEAAALYLDTDLKGKAASDLAHKLYVVLDTRLPARLNELSDRPEGAGDNPLRPDENTVGAISTDTGSFEVVVTRVAGTGASPLWLFSRRTLARVPEAYAEVDRVVVERYVPSVIGRPRIGGIRLFEWVLLLFVVPVVYRLLGLLNWVFRPLVRVWDRRTGVIDGRPPGHVPGLVRLLIIAIGIRWLLAFVDLPLFERQFWVSVAALLTMVSVAWFLLVLNGYGEAYLRRASGGDGEVTSLLRLARRVADVIVIAACVVLTLRYFGFDPTAALAGLGIGGIAVALAAQKTLENVIAGLSLIFDKAVKVGDTLKFGDTVGTVDYIGLRSTRIRTPDRTIMTVPNGQIANVGLETLSLRDKYWFHHFIGLQYQTTTDQMRAVIDGIEKLLVPHPNVDGSSVRVRFLRIGASSLDVEVSAYLFAADWDRFANVQQELLLRIMEIVNAAGTALAFPSRTLHITDERLPVARHEAVAVKAGR